MCRYVVPGDKGGAGEEVAPSGVTICGHRRANGGVFRRDDFVGRPSIKARYKTRCDRCGLWIQAGAEIWRDITLNQFVHTSCIEVHRHTVVRIARGAAVTAEAVKDVQHHRPHGLLQETLRDNEIELSRYT